LEKGEEGSGKRALYRAEWLMADLGHGRRFTVGFMGGNRVLHQVIHKSSHSFVQAKRLDSWIRKVKI